MLGKLFKYDMKSLSRIMWLFTIIIIPVSVLGAVAMRLTNTDLFSYESNRLIGTMLSQGLYAFVIMAFLAVVGYGVLTMIMIMRMYYTSFFTDQGYLTFTLPVKQRDLLLSKFFAGTLWLCISGIVCVACVFIMILFGTAQNGLVNLEVFDFFRNAFEYANSIAGVGGLLIEFCIQIIVMIPYIVLLLFTALTLGSVVAKKHKILASVGFYFAITTAVSIVRNVISAVLMVSALDATSERDLERVILSRGHISAIAYILLLVGLGVLFFFVNKRLITKKLNLN